MKVVPFSILTSNLGDRSFKKVTQYSYLSLSAVAFEFPVAVILNIIFARTAVIRPSLLHSACHAVNAFIIDALVETNLASYRQHLLQDTLYISKANKRKVEFKGRLLIHNTF